MDSIIQADFGRCYLCGRRGTGADPLDRHHVFFGALRKQSEKYGLVVYLHHTSCHIFGAGAVHANGEVCRALQADVQKRAMEHYGWSAAEFRRRFRKSYISK